MTITHEEAAKGIFYRLRRYSGDALATMTSEDAEVYRRESLLSILGRHYPGTAAEEFTVILTAVFPEAHERAATVEEVAAFAATLKVALPSLTPFLCEHD
ncbi:MAG TPA: hypothetical protein PLN52_26130 [Opitutaceae bacterium]|nr:hypothetical protein [Opitutaceae bacterium]